MEDDFSPLLDGSVAVEDVISLVGDTDRLLADAVQRLQLEQSGEIRDFFKHGDHGSHNSG